MLHKLTGSFTLGTDYDAKRLCLDALLKVSDQSPAKNLGGTGADNAFYGGVSYDSFLKQVNFRAYQYPCHTYMRYLQKPEAVYNRFTRRPTLSAKACRAYFDWIMSDDSPWKNFKNRLETHLPDDVPEDQKYEWIYNHGWVWSDFSAPSNLQHSFLVASRMPAEWPRMIGTWYRWQMTGLDKALCFAFLQVFYKHPKGRDKNNRQLWKINHVNQYDWPLDICTLGEDSLRDFCNGRMDDSKYNQPYKDGPFYWPVNVLFGPYINDDNNDKKYPYVIYNRYNQDYGLNETELKEYWANTGLGFSTFRRNQMWLVTEREILEIIRKEQERLLDSDATEVVGKNEALSA